MRDFLLYAGEVRPSADQTVRPAAVAGAFYPGDAASLRAEVDALLANAAPRKLTPKLLIAPHAGYVYSGPIAASAYRLLENLAPKPSRVVLLGPAHTVGFRGVALPAARALETPLGAVPVDEELVSVARGFDFVFDDARAHAREHSLEVHLPFLQRALGAFSVLPLCVGQVEAGDVAALLDAVWGGPETLIVISSDLSHYLLWSDAKQVDGDTARMILRCDAAELDGDRACGTYPLGGALLAAKRHGLTPTVLDLRNSGDTAGDRSRVVGYGAFAFCEGGAR